jgi:hypothetical protein
VDGVHQLVGKLEVVEAGLAFLRLDHEVFEFPQAGLGFGLALAAWLWRGGLLRADRLGGRLVGGGRGGLGLGAGARRRFGGRLRCRRGGVTATGSAAGGAASPWRTFS